MSMTDENIEYVLEIEPLGYNDPVSLAAAKMWEHQAPILPVVDARGKYAGIVSIFTLLKRRIPGSAKVGAVVERAPLLEDVSDQVSVARAFVKTGFPGLAVSLGGKSKGVVSARRLISAMKLQARVPASFLMYALRPLSPEDPIEQARKLMASVGLRIAPVALQGKLEGVLNVYDLVHFLPADAFPQKRIGGLF